MISRRQEIFSTRTCKFFSSIDCADNFFKFPKSRNMGSLCRQFFSDAPLGQTIYFSNFCHADKFFPNHDTPEEHNGPFLRAMLSDSQ